MLGPSSWPFAVRDGRQATARHLRLVRRRLALTRRAPLDAFCSRQRGGAQARRRTARDRSHGRPLSVDVRSVKNVGARVVVAVAGSLAVLLVLAILLIRLLPG